LGITSEGGRGRGDRKKGGGGYRGKKRVVLLTREGNLGNSFFIGKRKPGGFLSKGKNKRGGDRQRIPWGGGNDKREKGGWLWGYPSLCT